MDHVEVGGLRIAYQRAGSGPPLVLLHGGNEDSRSWQRQIDGLCDEFMVVAWDAPGCGQSSDPPETFRLPDFAHCVAGLVDALGIDRPHLLGLSFGGGLALEIYRCHPELPRSLVLASAYAGWAGSLPAEVVAERLQRFLREADRPPSEWVADYLPGFFAGPVSQELIDETTAMMCDARPAGIRAMARSFAEADLRDVLPRIVVPTLLLYGELDVRSPLAVAEAMHAAIPASSLVVIPGVGHCHNLESPERFNSEVRSFLRTVP